MENLLDYAPLPDQIRPGNKVLLSAAGGWATPTTGQQQFAHCTNDFDDALAVALAEQGQDASIAVNLVASTDANPPGRPVAWRVMPWREG